MNPEPRTLHPSHRPNRRVGAVALAEAALSPPKQMLSFCRQPRHSAVFCRLDSKRRHVHTCGQKPFHSWCGTRRLDHQDPDLRTPFHDSHAGGYRDAAQTDRGGGARGRRALLVVHAPRPIFKLPKFLKWTNTDLFAAWFVVTGDATPYASCGRFLEPLAPFPSWPFGNSGLAWPNGALNPTP